MGAKGEKLRTRIRKIIGKANLRSTATLNLYTFAFGGNGGYDNTTKTLSTSTSVYCIPSGYITDNFLQENVGNIETGDLAVLIRDDVTINQTALSDYEFTFNSKTYKIKEIRPVFFNDVLIAQTVILTEELS